MGTKNPTRPRRARVGSWTVFYDNDGRFGHARHDDPNRLIVWTVEELAAVDPAAARNV